MQVSSASPYAINAQNLHQLRQAAKSLQEKHLGEEGEARRIRARVEREIIKPQPHKGNLVNIRV